MNGMVEANKYEPCMSLFVSRYGQFVDLRIDSSRPAYSKTIEGIVGGDCGLICDMETHEVIGIHLRTVHEKLMVSHSGPFRLNEGFVKMDDPTRIYEHDGLKVEWRSQLCTHCGNCGASLPEVFDADRKPWVDLSQSEQQEIKRVVGECPSGALKIGV